MSDVAPTSVDVDVPVLVAPGWYRADTIVSDGPAYRLLWWPNERPGFEHRCDRGARGVIVCAPQLQPEHKITMENSHDGVACPTVTPSILCPDCGTHGFVTAGRWHDA